MGISRNLQPCGHPSPRQVRHALPRPGQERHFAPGLRGECRWLHFTRRSQPVLSPEAEYEKDGGVEDPRLVKFGDTYYLTYTGYNKKDAQLCLATSKDLVHWQRQGVILPAYKGNWNVGWTKSGAIVPEKINGKYWMYFLGTSADKTDQMGLAYSRPTSFIGPRLRISPCCRAAPVSFDSRVVEPGPPPIVTKDGIVLIYNAADDNLVYRTAIAVFDRNDPAQTDLAIRAAGLSSGTGLGKSRARFRMWSLSRAWSGRATATSSITAPPTNTSAWPRSRSFHDTCTNHVGTDALIRPAERSSATFLPAQNKSSCARPDGWGIRPYVVRATRAAAWEGCRVSPLPPRSGTWGQMSLSGYCGCRYRNKFRRRPPGAVRSAPRILPLRRRDT